MLHTGLCKFFSSGPIICMVSDDDFSIVKENTVVLPPLFGVIAYKCTTTS